MIAFPANFKSLFRRRFVLTAGLLSLAAATMVRRAAEELRDRGTYDFANDLIAHPEMNALLAR